MALSTVLHESQRVCERSLVLELYMTMIQEGWMSHREENNTPARSLKPHKYSGAEYVWDGEKENDGQTDSAPLTMTI